MFFFYYFMENYYRIALASDPKTKKRCNSKTFFDVTIRLSWHATENHSKALLKRFSTITRLKRLIYKSVNLFLKGWSGNVKLPLSLDSLYLIPFKGLVNMALLILYSEQSSCRVFQSIVLSWGCSPYSLVWKFNMYFLH